MTDKLDPLSWDVPIVDENRRPTPEFMRKWKLQREINGTIPVRFINLSDVPNSYTGASKKLLRVKSDLSGIEFHTEVFLDLADVPVTYAGQAGKALRVNAGQTGLEYYTPVLTVAFTQLTDVPASYSGQSLKGVRVNAGETGLEFYTTGGGGGGSDFTIWTTIPAQPGWDPNYVGGSSVVVLSNSNKTATPASGGPYNHCFGTPARNSGKKYFEIVPGSTSFAAFGVTSGAGRAASMPGNAIFGQNTPGQLGWAAAGAVSATTPLAAALTTYTVATVDTWTTSDRLSFAVDMDNQLIWFRKNAGNWNNNGAADPATGVGGISLAHAFNTASSPFLWPGGNMGNTAATSLYLLAADFTQSVPSGFSAWAT